MSAATQEAQSSFGEERVARALLLLREALEIIDSLGGHRELGARLNEDIESLTEVAGGK